MFITLYGINNIGKSTQATLLVERLRQRWKKVTYIKFPIYGLEPTGPLINEYLRGGNPHKFSPVEIQILHTLNRTQAQDEIKRGLRRGGIVVAEDYLGTSIAWGVGTGVEKGLLIRLQSHLLQPHVNILLHGKRFLLGRESGHKHEENDVLSKHVQGVHLDLAEEFGWHIIDANGTKEEVGDNIWHKVEKQLSLNLL